MSSVVFAPASDAPFISDPINQQRIEITYKGWDGSVWDLWDAATGVVASDGDVVGLHFPTFDVQSSTSPSRPGRRRLGARVKERSVTLPVFVFGRGADEWLQRCRRFLDAFHPLIPGELTVRAGTETRSLQVYLDSDGDHAYRRDPGRARGQRFQVPLTAEDPYWKGRPISGSWEKSEAAPFFTADGNLQIASGATLDLAEIANPGDVPAWAVWTVVAGVAPVQATITVDGGTIVTPTVPAGKTLVMDTDPGVGTLDLDGVDVSGQEPEWDPRPIPPGGIAPLSLQTDGFGSVSLQLTPRYWRAL